MGEAHMDQRVPEVIRVEVSGARIVQVTRKRIEYIDMAGREQFVDLEECARNWVRWHDEHRAEFIPVPGATQAEIDAENAQMVGERGEAGAVWWIELRNERKTRFEFETWEARSMELGGPLMQAGWLTFDTE